MMPTGAIEILNYVIVRKIGEGGMGEVYLARNRNIDQLVAIKRLHPRFAGNPVLREKFRKEALMLSELNHPNIVKFLNYVENPQGVFLIMEYVDGHTLEDYINRINGLIVEERSYPIILEILDAFSYAHSRGIIHRDIKPNNIYIDKEGHVKVIDFGIAQIMSDADSGNDMPAGTAEYMSPEQVLGRAVDVRSDIYSLGVVIHQMLTGQCPYDLNQLSEVEVKRRVISVNLRPMREYYPYISEGMQRVVDRATDKTPDSRYADCEAMRRDVLVCARRNKVRDSSSNGGGSGGNGSGGRGGSGSRQHPGGKGSGASLKSLWIALGITTALILIFGAGWWIWDYNRTKSAFYRNITVSEKGIEGRGPVERAEAAQLDTSFRLLTRHGAAFKVERAVVSRDSMNGSEVARHYMISVVEITRRADSLLAVRSDYNIAGLLNRRDTILLSGRQNPFLVKWKEDSVAAPDGQGTPAVKGASSKKGKRKGAARTYGNKYQNPNGMTNEGNNDLDKSNKNNR